MSRETMAIPGSSTSIRGILFTDMVGSTEQRARLGEDRADELRRAHDEILGTCVATHGGRVLRWTGDGVKADFASASAAVSAALDMQRSVLRYSRTASAVTPFEIRIGLGVGEVRDEDGDIHGVAVIEAARLESIAEPGEILATDLVHRLAERRVDAGFDDLGPQLLKGLAEPVQVVRIVDVASETSARPLPRVVLTDRRFPLVGRTHEVSAAAASWDDATGGVPTVALITGQPGMGKSRLVAHVCDVAHSNGAMVLAGVCDSDLDVPYQPFAIAFDEIRSVDDALAAAVDIGSGPLGPLFPSRRQRTDDHGPSARFDLFEAVVDLLQRLTQDQPVVLVLEDLHWATPPTVQLLRHVLRHAGSARVLVLASYRAEEIGPGHPLNDLLAEVKPGAPISKIDLQPLSEADVAQLVATRVTSAGPDAVDAFARRVREESAGIPFFVCELLHHLATIGELEGLVGLGASGEFPVPDTVRDIVGQRVGRVSAQTGDALRVAAIIGHTFDVDVLAAVIDGPVDEVVEALEDAERVALVREAAAGRFAFAHAIVRTAMLDATSATRRKIVHRRIAEAIEVLQPTDHDDLARHWSAAGVEDKANDRLESAARRDIEALAYESAAERFQALIDYHQRPGGDPAQRARAWLGLGLARRAMGLVIYRDAVEQAGRLARQLRDADLIADAAIASIWPGTMFAIAGRTDTAFVELCEDALALIGPDDPRRVRILSTLAGHLAFEEDRDRRVGYLHEAHALARADGDLELIGSVLVSEYMALWDPTTVERRATIAAEVARAARATGDPDLTFFGGFFTAVATAEACDVQAARRQLTALRDDADATHNFYFRFLVDRFIISLDILSGRAGVQDDVDALAAKYDETHADTAGTWSIQTGGIALQNGTFGGLAPALRSMIEQSTVGSNWTAAYGLALALNGDLEAAADILATVEDPQLDYFWSVTTISIAELVLTLGSTVHAAPLRERLTPFRDQLAISASGSMCPGMIRTSLGLLALLDGDHAEAIELLDDAMRVADEMGALYEATKARRGLAAAMLAAGRPPDEIDPIIDAADTLARRHGFVGEQLHLAQIVSTRST